MIGKHASKTLALSVAIVLPSIATAEGTLTLRGGYAQAMEEYPFAAIEGVADDKPKKIFEADYGGGLYSHIAYANDAMFGSIGGEISLSYSKLTGDTTKVPVSDDDVYVYDVIALTHDDYVSGAKTSNDTQLGQLRAMASYDSSGSGMQFLGGIGVMHLSSDIHGSTLYPGEYSKIDRSTDYTGLGLVLGARKSFPVTDYAVLQIEGFAGAYSGDRKVNIKDQYLSSGDKGYFSKKDKHTVFSLDLAASLAMPVDRFSKGSVFEVGLAYNRVFNVMDTSNYNSYTDGSPDADFSYRTGSDSDDIDALSLFFGLQIPL